MGFLSGLFGGGKQNNPANAAMPYLNQVAPMANKNLGPWNQQGQQAQQNNQPIYNNMANDPAAFLNQLQASYKPSTGYQFKKDQMEKASYGAAAAGGRVSTDANQQAQQQLVQGLLSEDMGSYIDKILGIQGTGLQGNENVANRGYGAAGDLTNVLGTTLGNQGQLAFKGKENENATKQAFNKMLMQLLGGGAGFALGGPAGAAIGANAAGGFASSYSPPGNNQMSGSGLPWQQGAR